MELNTDVLVLPKYVFNYDEVGRDAAGGFGFSSLFVPTSARYHSNKQ